MPDMTQIGVIPIMNKNIKIHESWLKYIEAEFDKKYMRNVKNSILNSKESGKIIYPKNSTNCD